MKKIFSILAAAVIALSFASCNQNNPDVPTVKLHFTEGVQFTDEVASLGWWQVIAQDTTYLVSLSNDGSISQAAGTYTAAQLDAEYSYVKSLATGTEVTFTDGSITLAVSGKQVSITGTLTGSDSLLYDVKIIYTEPEAKKTVNINITDGALYDEYADYGLYVVYGGDPTAYVQLGIWTEDAFQGHFTEDDLDDSFIGSRIQDADGQQSIFTASIDVTPGNGEGYYNIAADLLCYNNTLYKVTMAVVPEEGDGIAAKKAPAKKNINIFKGAKKAL